MLPRFRPLTTAGAFVRAQFGEDAPDLTLDGVFRDRERRGDVLVRPAVRDQPQDA